MSARSRTRSSWNWPSRTRSRGERGPGLSGLGTRYIGLPTRHDRRWARNHRPSLARVIPNIFDVDLIRSRFPALTHGAPDAYLDGPGGTQVPRSVIDAMGGALAGGMSNVGGAFDRSRASDEVVAGARRAVADLMDADP